MSDTRNPVGRPRHFEELKSAALGIKTTPTLRKMVEDAAEAAGRTISQEIEARLLQSFRLPPPPSVVDTIRQIIREEMSRARGEG